MAAAARAAGLDFWAAVAAAAAAAGAAAAAAAVAGAAASDVAVAAAAAFEQRHFEQRQPDRPTSAVHVYLHGRIRRENRSQLAQIDAAP